MILYFHNFCRQRQRFKGFWSIPIITMLTQLLPQPIRLVELSQSDNIWQHKSRSPLAQVMTLCQTASSDHLSQCWKLVLLLSQCLMIVLFHSFSIPLSSVAPDECIDDRLTFKSYSSSSSKHKQYLEETEPVFTTISLVKCYDHSQIRRIAKLRKCNLWNRGITSFLFNVLATIYVEVSIVYIRLKMISKVVYV